MTDQEMAIKLEEVGFPTEDLDRLRKLILAIRSVACDMDVDPEFIINLVAAESSGRSVI